MSNQIQIKGDFQFPTEWTLFGPVERGTAEPDFSAMTEPGLPAQPVSLRRDRGCWEVDLGALLGGVSEGKTAWLVTSLTVDREMEVTLGASADWWMQWRLNGQTIYDTLAQGNGGYPYHSFLVHRFVARLKTGRNLLVVKVVSGSGGFRLCAGGPRELRQLLPTQESLNAILKIPEIVFNPFPAYAGKYLSFAMASSIEVTCGGRIWTCWAGGELSAIRVTPPQLINWFCNIQEGAHVLQKMG